MEARDEYLVLCHREPYCRDVIGLHSWLARGRMEEHVRVIAQMMVDGRAVCAVSVEGAMLRETIKQAIGRLIHTADEYADNNWDHIEIYVDRWENGGSSST